MKRSTLWVVTDQLPYPPRNGITLPLFHYLSILKNTFQINLVLLVDVDFLPTATALKENTELFGVITQIPLRRRSRMRRLLGELGATEMYQHGWEPVLPSLAVEFAASDAALISPMSAVAKWQAVAKYSRVAAAVQIAAVNDCTTAEYFYRGYSAGGSWRSAFKGWIDRLRCRNIAKIEAAKLAHYRYVLLQTPTDRVLMSKLVSSAIADKVRLAPNGVSETLLQLPRQPGNQIIFVGELSGEYAQTARWLLGAVWPAIAAKYANVELLLVGRGAQENLRNQIKQSERVRHIEYVQDLGDVYATAMIALSPVFKGFGLINKTLEAMACGIPVVGGSAAFNGITGFKDGVHGVVSDSFATDEFIAALEQVLSSVELRQQIGCAARELISGQFRWSHATTVISELVAG